MAGVQYVVPTTMIFDDEFNVQYGSNGAGGHLPNPVYWYPGWLDSDGQFQNNSTMLMANVNVNPATGLQLSVDASGNGSIIHSGPPSQGGGAQTGFMLQATAGHPVYLEYAATVPGAAGNAYNWIGLWATPYNTNWPGDVEVDNVETYGDFEFHLEYPNAPGYYGWPGVTTANPGSGGGAYSGGWGGSGSPPGVGWTAGQHTFGALITTTGAAWVVDGTLRMVIAGTDPTGDFPPPPVGGPKGLVLENGRNGDGSFVSSTLTVRYVRVWQN